MKFRGALLLVAILTATLGGCASEPAPAPVDETRDELPVPELIKFVAEMKSLDGVQYGSFQQSGEYVQLACRTMDELMGEPDMTLDEAARQTVDKVEYDDLSSGTQSRLRETLLLGTKYYCPAYEEVIAKHA